MYRCRDEILPFTGTSHWWAPEQSIPLGVGLSLLSGGSRPRSGAPCSWEDLSGCLGVEDSWVVPRMDRQGTCLVLASSTLALLRWLRS